MKDTIPTSWKAKVQALRASGIEPDLPTLIALARTHQWSAEEMEASRRSWVIGEMMLRDPNLRRSRAEALYEEVKKEHGL